MFVPPASTSSLTSSSEVGTIETALLEDRSRVCTTSEYLKCVVTGQGRYTRDCTTRGPLASVPPASTSSVSSPVEVGTIDRTTRGTLACVFEVSLRCSYYTDFVDIALSIFSIE